MTTNHCMILIPALLPFYLPSVFPAPASTIATLVFCHSLNIPGKYLGPLHWPFSLLELSFFRCVYGFFSVKITLRNLFKNVVGPIQPVSQIDVLFPALSFL